MRCVTNEAAASCDPKILAKLGKSTPDSVTGESTLPKRPSSITAVETPRHRKSSKSSRYDEIEVNRLLRWGRRSARASWRMPNDTSKVTAGPWPAVFARAPPGPSSAQPVAAVLRRPAATAIRTAARASAQGAPRNACFPSTDTICVAVTRLPASILGNRRSGCSRPPTSSVSSFVDKGDHHGRKRFDSLRAGHCALDRSDECSECPRTGTPSRHCRFGDGARCGPRVCHRASKRSRKSWV